LKIIKNLADVFETDDITECMIKSIVGKKRTKDVKGYSITYDVFKQVCM
jgi:hypothetical protein